MCLCQSFEELVKTIKKEKKIPKIIKKINKRSDFPVKQWVYGNLKFVFTTDYNGAGRITYCNYHNRHIRIYRFIAVYYKKDGKPYLAESIAYNNENLSEKKTHNHYFKIEQGKIRKTDGKTYLQLITKE